MAGIEPEPSGSVAERPVYRGRCTVNMQGGYRARKIIFSLPLGGLVDAHRGRNVEEMNNQQRALRFDLP